MQPENATRNRKHLRERWEICERRREEEGGVMKKERVSKNEEKYARENVGK